MAFYAFGDIQGCHAEFCQLLDLVGFSPREDRLWLVGDLVNRGPGSLAVLREVMALGDAAVTVLGNHDFHLLTIAAGHRKPHRSDTLDAILAAPDRDALVAWLTARPLVVAEGDFAMVHAGFLPSWTVATALALSAEVQAMLASGHAHEFLRVLYGDAPHRWSDGLAGFDLEDSGDVTAADGQLVGAGAGDRQVVGDVELACGQGDRAGQPRLEVDGVVRAVP